MALLLAAASVVNAMRICDRLPLVVDNCVDQHINLNIHINMIHFYFVQPNNQSQKRNSKLNFIARFATIMLDNHNSKYT